MNWFKKIFSATELSAKTKSVAGLDELKRFIKSSHSVEEFIKKAKSSGYIIEDQTSWGSIIMKRKHDKFIYSTSQRSHKNELFNVIYRNEVEDLKVDLVNEFNILF